MTGTEQKPCIKLFTFSRFRGKIYAYHFKRREINDRKRAVLSKSDERDRLDDAFLFAFAQCIFGFDGGFDVAFAEREIPEDEVLPWDVIDCGVDRRFLQRERKKAYESVTTPCCKESCAGCGASKMGGNCTWCPGK